ncbi:MAG TPA: hypothetical protein V6C86_14795 [Oculatellaceae cyanobacterium]
MGKSRKRSSSDNRKIYGTWPRGLKIAIAVSLASLVGIAGALVGLVYLSSQAQDISRTKQIASSFMKIAEPLPDGFQYVSGVDLFGTKMVMIGHQGTGAVWTLVHVSSAEGALPPETVIKQIEASAKSARTVSQAKGEFIVHEKGQQKVGGRELTYESGEFTSGKVSTGSLIGCFMPNQNGTTCIFAHTPLGEFDENANQQLLAAIHAI